MSGHKGFAQIYTARLHSLSTSLKLKDGNSKRTLVRKEKNITQKICRTARNTLATVFSGRVNLIVVFLTARRNYSLPLKSLGNQKNKKRIAIIRIELNCK